MPTKIAGLDMRRPTQHNCCIAALHAASGQHRQEEHIMSTRHKSSGAAAAIGAQIDQLTAEYAKGIGTGLKELTELKGQAFEVAAQYNTEMVSAWQKGAALSTEALKQSAQAQKDIFEVAVARGRVATRLAAEQVEAFTRLSAGVTAVFETLATLATSTQTQVLDFAASQNGAAYDAATQQFASSARAAVETFQAGVDTVIETQRSVRTARSAA
jgi:hypothetical protein